MYISILIITILHIAYNAELVSSSIEVDEPWKLPLIPADLSSRKAAFKLYKDNATNDKLIPRHFWVAVRDINDGLNYQMPALFNRNANWDIHVVSNEEKDLFMNTTWANTSILWAYHSIHPEAGAAKADIWRFLFILCNAYSYI